MSTIYRSIATAVFWVAAALAVSPPVRAQPEAPLTGKWLGKAMFRATGERADGDVVFEPPNGLRGAFLRQPLVDVSRRDRTLRFTWGEGEGAVRCTLPWDEEKMSFRGDCVAAGREAAAVLEFIPLAQSADHADEESEQNRTTR